MLRLNFGVGVIAVPLKKIQIQPMLRLNPFHANSLDKGVGIQIQPMLRLN